MARRDHERTGLPGDVDERRLPLIAVVGGRRDVDLDAGAVEREARERHVVLPADETADAAELGRQRLQAAAVALAPDQALVVRRHELAVVKRERAVGGVVEQRVVQRAGPLGIDLVDAGDEPHAVLACDCAEPVGVGPRHGERLAREQRERRLRTRVAPAGEVPRPDRGRVRGHVRLREDDQIGAAPRGLRGQPLELVERSCAVEDDRLRLHARDGDPVAHGLISPLA